ncbi:MAG: hypothetical protein ACTS41_00440 [Candidatus Hodgkinia cicadicola]
MFNGLRLTKFEDMIVNWWFNLHSSILLPRLWLVIIMKCKQVYVRLI